MRRILLIMAKDMRRRVRSPGSILSMLAIPIVLTLIIGLIFGPGGEVELPRIKVLLADEDRGIFSHFLRQGLREGRFEELIEVTEITRAEGRALMDKGKASALIVIPEGFSASILDGEPAAIELLKNPAEAFLPMIVEEITETMAVAIDGLVEVFGGPLAGVRALLAGDRWPTGTELTSVLDAARPRFALVQGYLADTLIALETETAAGGEADGGTGFNIFAVLMPGSMLIGLLFIGEIAMRDVLRERDARTLARMIAGPVAPVEVLGGKVLSAVALTGLSCILLVAIGRFGFGISWGNGWALAAQIIGDILMCTGIMAFLYGIIRSDRVADAAIPIVIIVMCLFGGTMVPYESMSAGMKEIAQYSPVFWASDGLKKIALEGAGFQGIALHLGIVYGIGIATLAAGAAMLGARLRKGGW